MGLFSRKKSKESEPWWRRRKDGTKKENKTVSYLKDLFFRAFDSLLLKIVIGAVGATGIAGFIYRNYFENPRIDLVIEGYVHVYDNPDRPLAGATVFIEGKNTTLTTGDDGRYSGEVEIRKKDKQIVLTCEKKPLFPPRTKVVDIPLEKKPVVKTIFQLDTF